MEEWGKYILVALFAGVSLIHNLLKEKKQSDDEPEMSPAGNTTADDAPMVPFEPQESAEQRIERQQRAEARKARIEELRRRQAEQKSEAQSLEVIPEGYEHPVSLETIIDEVAVHAARTNPKQRRSAQPQPARPSADPQKNVSEVSAEEGSPTAASTVAEFDLERAVIYSEVLAPKFKEYE